MKNIQIEQAEPSRTKGGGIDIPVIIIPAKLEFTLTIGYPYGRINPGEELQFDVLVSEKVEGIHHQARLLLMKCLDTCLQRYTWASPYDRSECGDHSWESVRISDRQIRGHDPYRRAWVMIRLWLGGFLAELDKEIEQEFHSPFDIVPINSQENNPTFQLQEPGNPYQPPVKQ